VSAGSGFVVALDTQLNEDLVREGLARELVNKVQNMRKTADLDIAQRIHVAYEGDAQVMEAVKAHLDYVASEVLAVQCEGGGLDHPLATEELDLNGHPCRVSIRPV